MFLSSFFALRHSSIARSMAAYVHTALMMMHFPVYSWKEWWWWWDDDDDDDDDDEWYGDAKEKALVFPPVRDSPLAQASSCIQIMMMIVSI